MRSGFALGRVIASAGLVALITLSSVRFVRVNPTTVALSYAVAILLVATNRAGDMQDTVVADRSIRHANA